MCKFLITLMSGLAEEESRSISENVKWGQRKRFADGKHHMPFKYFLGYRKEATPLFLAEGLQIIFISFIYALLRLTLYKRIYPYTFISPP